MNSKNLIKIGTITLVFGALIGILGPIFQLLKSFESFASGENAGIGAVGQSVYNSIYLTIFSIAVILSGLCLIIFGAFKNRNR